MHSAQSKNSNIAQAYLLLRLGMGISFVLHGVTRFADVGYFHKILEAGLSGTTEQIVLSAFVYALPAVEILAGIMLILGFGRRVALVSLSLVMCILLSASILADHWNGLAIQLIFFFILYWLYSHLHDDRLSFDRFLKL